jgi:RNA polymerase sigma-70 factor, ECF subfamily
MVHVLAHAFLESAGSHDADPDLLEGALRRIVAEAQAAWPELTVAPDQLARYLGGRIARRPLGAPEVHLLAALEALHATDLYLACACLAGQREAIAIFEARYLAKVDQVLLRIGMPAWVVDETKQVLRCRFFVPRGEGAESSLEDYAGHGSLQAWVSAAAVHTAFRVAQTPKRQTDADSLVMRAISAPGDDLELDYLKRRYAHEFEEALVEAFASLTARERTILRCYHLDSAGIDGVAALYDVHRVTAWRWVRRLTNDLLKRTRARLVDRSRADRAEVSSILRLIQSRVDAIVHTVLSTTTTDQA